MVFRLMMSAKKKWRKINGPNRLPEVIQGVVFKDGIKSSVNFGPFDVRLRLPAADVRSVRV